MFISSATRSDGQNQLPRNNRDLWGTFAVRLNPRVGDSNPPLGTKIRQTVILQAGVSSFVESKLASRSQFNGARLGGVAARRLALMQHGQP